MSTTKKTGVVHTITAEQKEKMDKQAEMQARMETGKVEICLLYTSGGRCVCGRNRS